MDSPAAAASFQARGVKIPFDRAIIAQKLKRALRRNRYEAKEINAALRCVTAGDTVLELGGGLGYVASVLALKRAPKAIHSFEANPHLIAFQRQLHALNGIDTITAHNALLAPRKGKPQRFFVREDFLASSLLEEVPGKPVRSVETIEVRGLNATFNALKPDVFICDIEGAEAALLPHLKYTGLRAAIIELHPQWIGAAGVRAVFEAMHAAGLSYFPRWSDQKVVCFRKDWALK